MTEGIFRKRRRPEAQPVPRELVRDDLLQRSDTLDADISNIVVAGFQLPPALLLSVLRDGLRRRLG